MSEGNRKEGKRGGKGCDRRCEEQGRKEGKNEGECETKTTAGRKHIFPAFACLDSACKVFVALK